MADVDRWIGVTSHPSLATKHGLGSTRQAISQHLAVLEDAGLVTTRRDGRYKFHHFNATPLAQIPLRWPARKEHS